MLFFPFIKIAIEQMNGSLNRNQITIDLMLDVVWCLLISIIITVHTNKTQSFYYYYYYLSMVICQPSVQSNIKIVNLYLNFKNMHLRRPILAFAIQHTAIGTSNAKTNACINNEIIVWISFNIWNAWKCLSSIINILYFQFGTRTSWHSQIIWKSIIHHPPNCNSPFCYTAMAMWMMM